MRLPNRIVVLITFALTVGLLACSGEQSATTSMSATGSERGGAEDKGDQPRENGPESQKTANDTEKAQQGGGTEYDDPGPSLSQQTGIDNATVEKSQEVTASLLEHEGAWYVTLQAEIWPTVYWIEVKAGDAHGFAVAEPNGDSLTVRFTTEPPPEFSLEVFSGNVSETYKKTVSVSLTEARSEGGATVASGFFEDASDWFADRGSPGWRRQSPFYTFASHRLKYMAWGATGKRPDQFQRPQRRTSAGELMALYTGMTSVEEALQADRGLRIRSNQGKTEWVKLSEVEPVTLAAHPWEKMIAELGGKDAVKMEPLADAVPHDYIYVHFSDLRDLVGLAKDMDEWISPAGQALEGKPGQSHMFDRYQTALGLERSGLSETLGHLAADGVALVASDPFLREGTDLSILFRIKNLELLESALAKYEAIYRERFPGLKASSTTIAGQEVQLLQSPGGEVNQHRLVLGDNLIVSNSAEAIEALIAVHEGQRPALSSSGDFQYMRALYPWSAEDSRDGDAEDGFVFIGDALVANAISPERRILQGRRMAARGDLAAVNHAALLYGWLEGKPPTDINDVVKAGYLAKDELKHADGTRIQYTVRTGAHSDRWGSLAGMTPLADMLGGKAFSAKRMKVTQEEAAAYKEFRETYQSYWRTFIDPIGIRLARTDNGGVSLDGRMLPLIDVSEYSELVELIGAGRVMRPPFDAALQWTMAVGPDSELRSELEGAGVWVGVEPGGWSWLGDWVVIGTTDRSGLWDLALAIGEVPEAGDRKSDDTAVFNAIDRFPLFLAVHVTDREVLAKTLGALRQSLHQQSGGVLTFGKDESHRGVDVHTIVLAKGVLDSGQKETTFYRAVAGDVLLLTADKPTLLMQIDAVLDDSQTWQLDGSDEAEQVSFRIAPDHDAGWLEKTLLGVTGSELIQAHEMTELAYGALARGLGDEWPTGSTAEDQQLRKEIALAWIGYVPTSIQGGELGMKDGMVQDTVYGNAAERHYPEVPVKGAPLTEAFGQLEALDMKMGFEQFEDSDGGSHMGLHVRATLERTR